MICNGLTPAEFNYLIKGDVRLDRTSNNDNNWEIRNLDDPEDFDCIILEKKKILFNPRRSTGYILRVKNRKQLEKVFEAIIQDFREP